MSMFVMNQLNCKRIRLNDEIKFVVMCKEILSDMLSFILYFFSYKYGQVHSELQLFVVKVSYMVSYLEVSMRLNKYLFNSYAEKFS